jgi:hypothetical protein
MWLTITFAAILAIYFSHSNITAYMKRLLIGSYVDASIALIGKWRRKFLPFFLLTKDN